MGLWELRKRNGSTRSGNLYSQMNSSDEFLRSSILSSADADSVKVPPKLFGISVLDSGAAQGPRGLGKSGYIINIDSLIGPGLAGP
jgi:hypothetical protein